MFGSFLRRTQRDNKNQRSRNKLFRSLRIEPLEGRALLAGDVTVSLVGTTLTSDGESSANEVEITPGTNVGEYRITGLNNTIINGPSLIVDPFDILNVDLNGSSAIFTIRGTSPTNKLIIA